MLLPRLAAISEVLWSPKQHRDEENFFSRIEAQLHRYEAAEYTVARSLYSVSMSSVLDTVERRLLVSLANESGGTPIRYTLDGSTPTANSLAYSGPFVADRSLVIKAVSVRNGQLLSAPATHHVFIHKAIARPVSVKTPYHKYTGGGAFGLTNGMLGAKANDDSNWQGYEQSDLDATVDLGAVTVITRVTTHFLVDHHSWIFGPAAVRYEVSDDGKTFTSAGTFEFPVPAAAQELSILEVSHSVPSVKARYVRIYAQNIGVCPPWHISRGGKAWLFVDEIVVE